MMETPEGFVPQEQHDQAMLTLRAELSEAIDAKQTEINNLTSQLATLAVENATKLEALQTELDQAKKSATSYQNDNQALRKNLADYLMSTDGGQAALREFNIYILQTQQSTIAKRLAELGVT